MKGLRRRNHAPAKGLQAEDPGREQVKPASLRGARDVRASSAPFPGERQVSSCHEDVQTIHASVIFPLYVSDGGRSSLDVHPLVLPSQCNPGLGMFVALVIERTAVIPGTDAVLGCPDWSRRCQELCIDLPENVILPIPVQADRVPSIFARCSGFCNSGCVVKRCG